MASLRTSATRHLSQVSHLSRTSQLLLRQQHSTSSVDPTEVAHFDALASTWWDPHGSSRLLHLMNPLRHDFIASCLSSQPTPAPSANALRYLDVGCGGGIFAESAARLAHTASVTAIDPSSAVLAIARKHARQDPALRRNGKLVYLDRSIEQLPMPQSKEDQFDILTLFEVIEHVAQPAPFLAACLPFVKPGGWLVLSTIARTWMSWLTTKLVAEDLARIVPRGTHDWERYINEEELRRWFAGQDGWDRPRSMGAVYVPGLGWREVQGGERLGNYFFAIQKGIVE